MSVRWRLLNFSRSIYNKKSAKAQQKGYPQQKANMLIRRYRLGGTIPLQEVLEVGIISVGNISLTNNIKQA